MLKIAFVSSLILSIWMSAEEAFRIAFGSIYLLLFPGLIWTYALKFKADTVIVRLIFATALSIIVIVLFSYYLNFIGIQLNHLTILLLSLFISGLGGLVFRINQPRHQK